jgi:hypothetical protein
MDRTILWLLSTCFILTLLVVHYGIKSDQLERQLTATNNMVKTMCHCRPWR